MPDYKEMYTKMTQAAEAAASALDVYGGLVGAEAVKLRKAIWDVKEIYVGEESPEK